MLTTHVDGTCGEDAGYGIGSQLKSGNVVKTGDELPNLARRLASIVNANGGPTAVASGADVPLSSLSRYMKGENDPSALRLAAIARYCRVTMDHLVYGDASDPNIAFQLPKMVQTTGLSPEDVAMIPLLDVVVSAGHGYENGRPYEIDLLPFPRSWLIRLGLPEEHARFLGCRGDSMEPTINDGAIVLADTRFQHAHSEGIYVLVDGNSVRIKRIALGWQGAIQLLSDNERYQPEQLSPPDAEALRIAGKIVWAGGEL